MTLIALSFALAGFAASLSWLAVLLKRAIQSVVSDLLNGMAEGVDI